MTGTGTPTMLLQVVHAPLSTSYKGLRAVKALRREAFAEHQAREGSLQHFGHTFDAP